MTMDLQIDGAAQMQKLLREFPVRIQRDIVNSVASRGATIVKKHAKRNLRANGSDETGTLYKAIRTKKKNGVHGVYIVYTDKTGWYSHLVEFGHGAVKLKKPVKMELMPGQWRTVTHTGTAPAKPFFRPALDENENEVLAEMTKHMAKRMDKEAEKMCRDYRTLSKSYKKKLAK